MPTIDVSAGELFDRITILEIKLAKIVDPVRLQNVRREYEAIVQVLAAGVEYGRVAMLRAELKAVNETLWDIEDRIRSHEHRKDFGSTFIELARAVYINNDRRAEIKRRINESLGSQLVEEKSYTPY